MTINIVAENRQTAIKKLDKMIDDGNVPKGVWCVYSDFCGPDYIAEWFGHDILLGV